MKFIVECCLPFFHGWSSVDEATTWWWWGIPSLGSFASMIHDAGIATSPRLITFRFSLTVISSKGLST